MLNLDNTLSKINGVTSDRTQNIYKMFHFEAYILSRSTELYYSLSNLN